MAPEHGHDPGGAPIPPHIGKRTRRPSTPQETARRKAWAVEWGTVGAEYRRERLAKEGRT